MTSLQLISTDEFCHHYKVESEFIHSLIRHGLIHLHQKDNDTYIDIDELNQIERVIRLHYEMDINLEGIEAIINLLQKVSSMQEEIVMLKNKLRNYDDLSD